MCMKNIDAPGDKKVQIAIFRMKDTALVSFERVSLVDYAC